MPLRRIEICERLQCVSAKAGISKPYPEDFVRASFVTWAQQAVLNNDAISRDQIDYEGLRRSYSPAITGFEQHTPEVLGWQGYRVRAINSSRSTA